MAKPTHASAELGQIWTQTDGTIGCGLTERGEAAYRDFLRDVFDLTPERFSDRDPAWVRFALFEADGRCVAGIEAALLRIVADGHPIEVAAIRRVGVAATHRGRGLFRNLMTQALAWCAARCDGPALLYTENPPLYSRFGFEPLAQHAFVGPTPTPAPVQPAEIVGIETAERLVDRLMPGRAAISSAFAILGARDLLRGNLRQDHLAAAYAGDLDALILHEVEDDTLVVVDVVAAAMPTLAHIVGALRWRGERVRVLFPSDRLAWTGTPEADDTGLMIRGDVPAAMTRPFMLPPTMEF